MTGKDPRQDGEGHLGHLSAGGTAHHGGPMTPEHRQRNARQAQSPERNQNLTQWPTRLGVGLPWMVVSATAVAGGALAVLATLASAELYDDVEDGEGVSRWDRPLLDWVAGLRTPWLDQTVTAFTDLGSTRLMVPLVLAAAGLLWWRWRHPTPAILLALAAAGSVLMTVVGKDLVGRARPPLALAVPPYETSPSFPSGHTLNSWVLWILIGYLIATCLSTRRNALSALITAVVLAMGMGLSRVYLGHHWPTDVLVAWALGTAWLAVLVTGHRIALVTRHPIDSDPRPRPGGTDRSCID